ncbi:hypothetical protein JOB18_020400 [Solea senegalensis]|uniref:Uncharacterized protein n=1 Tax=Solea senegalensis TaxID=28829 RepID=A0AAV6PQH8_SOLSE|nr:hypothetical protein JOB18_020400 [Solea senegalensis]
MRAAEFWSVSRTAQMNLTDGCVTQTLDYHPDYAENNTIDERGASLPEGGIVSFSAHTNTPSTVEDNAAQPDKNTLVKLNSKNEFNTKWDTRMRFPPNAADSVSRCVANSQSKPTVALRLVSAAVLANCYQHVRFPPYSSSMFNINFQGRQREIALWDCGEAVADGGRLDSRAEKRPAKPAVKLPTIGGHNTTTRCLTGHGQKDEEG